MIVVAGLLAVLLLRKGPDEAQTVASKSKASPETSRTTVETTRDTTTVTQTEQAAVDPCSPAVIAAQGLSNGRFHASVCQDGWMYGGIPQTDATGIYYWDGQRWQGYQAHGETFTGFECYNYAQMRSDGAPEAVVQRALECKPNNTPTHLTAAEPACDGRNILIAESVIVHPGEDADVLISEALSRHPRAQFTNPGHCSSLRPQAEGGDVYPIYYDFGRDTEAMCARKASLGGNGRTLNNDVDFTDPCL